MALHDTLFSTIEALKDLPMFTEAQVAALEKAYPPRCLKADEAVEDHLRYAGKVDLIATLRSRVPKAEEGVELSPEEQEALIEAGDYESAAAIIKSGDT